MKEIYKIIAGHTHLSNLLHDETTFANLQAFLSRAKSDLQPESNTLKRFEKQANNALQSAAKDILRKLSSTDTSDKQKDLTSVANSKEPIELIHLFHFLRYSDTDVVYSFLSYLVDELKQPQSESKEPAKPNVPKNPLSENDDHAFDLPTDATRFIDDSEKHFSDAIPTANYNDLLRNPISQLNSIPFDYTQPNDAAKTPLFDIEKAMSSIAFAQAVAKPAKTPNPYYLVSSEAIKDLPENAEFYLHCGNFRTVFLIHVPENGFYILSKTGNQTLFNALERGYKAIKSYNQHELTKFKRGTYNANTPQIISLENALEPTKTYTIIENALFEIPQDSKVCQRFVNECLENGDSEAFDAIQKVVQPQNETVFEAIKAQYASTVNLMPKNAAPSYLAISRQLITDSIENAFYYQSKNKNYVVLQDTDKSLSCIGQSFTKNTYLFDSVIFHPKLSELGNIELVRYGFIENDTHHDAINNPNLFWVRNTNESIWYMTIVCGYLIETPKNSPFNQKYVLDAINRKGRGLYEDAAWDVISSVIPDNHILLTKIDDLIKNSDKL